MPATGRALSHPGKYAQACDENPNCIAFVALTRAKCEVHISWATQHEAAKPSLFCKPKERQVSRYFTGDMFEQDASPMENLQ